MQVHDKLIVTNLAGEMTAKCGGLTEREDSGEQFTAVVVVLEMGLRRAVPIKEVSLCKM